MKVNLKVPISDAEIRQLNVGDSVNLSGVMITGRDAVHKWMAETIIQKTKPQSEEDRDIFSVIKPILNGGIIYHCGPLVVGMDTKTYHFIAAGPTTSIREEPYQAEIMRHFNLKGIIGKGGMGNKTLQACGDVPAVYFHAIGGAASVIAQSVKRVIGVYKLEFGVPEAIWVIEVKDFPVIVTMDSRGNSLHASVRIHSGKVLERLLNFGEND